MAIKIGNSPIDNAAQPYTFRVTPADIRNGQPNDPCACAAARALKREFDARDVFVFRDVTYIYTKAKKALRYKTSAPLRLETVVFDRQGQFYPGEYELHPAPMRSQSAKKPTGGKRGGPSRRQGIRHSIPNVRPSASSKLPQV